MNINVTLLGTASGLPASDRFGQTVVVTIRTGEQQQHYLLDVGDGASSLFMRYGFDHRDIAAIVISHMHGDHHAGFVQVVKTCMHLQRTASLPILTPGEGCAILQTYVEGSYLTPAFLGFPLQWISLADSAGPLSLPGGVTVSVYKNGHLAWFRQHVGGETRFTFESYSIVLQAGQYRLVYSGNLDGPCGSDEMAPFVEPADLLITELAHVNPVELGRFLAGREIKHTLVTHYHPKWNGVADEEIRAMIVQGAGPAGLVGELTLARDGTVIAG